MQLILFQALKYSFRNVELKIFLKDIILKIFFEINYLENRKLMTSGFYQLCVLRINFIPFLNRKSKYYSK